MLNFKSKTITRGFTIVELLVVIVVIGILATIAIAALNPGELSAQARDSRRVTDINTIKSAVDLFIIDKTDPALLGVSSKVYISIPDTSSTCANITGLPTLPAGWSYNCVTTANLQKVDGTGWIPINFTVLGSYPVKLLPIDPSNSPSTGRYYTYIANTTSGLYEITALTEAIKNFATIKDGGRFIEMYEAGSDFTLQPISRDPSLVGYWAFNGTLGSIANGQTSGLVDSSGKGNNGTASNTNGTGMAFVAGKVGNAAQFDGADDGVAITTMNSGNTNWTMAVWAKLGASDERSIMSNSNSGPVQNLLGTSSSKILYRHYDGTWKYEYGTSNIADGNWHYLTWVNNSIGTIDLYVDGNKELSAAASITSNTGPLDRLGNAWSSSLSWNGLLDDLRFYNRSLSTNEVQAMYNATK